MSDVDEAELRRIRERYGDIMSDEDKVLFPTAQEKEVFKSKRDMLNDRLNFLRHTVFAELWSERWSCWLGLFMSFIMQGVPTADGSEWVCVGIISSMLVALYYRRWGGRLFDDSTDMEWTNRGCLCIIALVWGWVLYFFFFYRYPLASVFLLWILLPGRALYCILKKRTFFPAYKKSYSGVLSRIAPGSVWIMRRVNVLVGRTRNIQALYILFLTQPSHLINLPAPLLNPA